MKKQSRYWNSPRHVIIFGLMVLFNLAFLVSLIVGIINTFIKMKEMGAEAEPDPNIVTAAAVFLILGALTLTIFFVDLIEYFIRSKHMNNSELNVPRPQSPSEKALFKIEPSSSRELSPRIIATGLWYGNWYLVLLSFIATIAFLALSIVTTIIGQEEMFYIILYWIAAGLFIVVSIIMICLPFFASKKIKNGHLTGYRLFEDHIENYHLENNEEIVTLSIFFKGMFKYHETKRAMYFFFYLNKKKMVEIIVKKDIENTAIEFLRKKGQEIKA